MRTIDEWMTELAALRPDLPEATNDGLDRLWAAIMDEGDASRVDDLAHK